MAEAREAAEFLLEIGCEEIPAAWLTGLTAQVRQRFTELATREHLVPTDLQALSTPRRLVLGARLPAAQLDRETQVWGPSLQQASDAAGKWTGAAQGFARKNGVSPEDLSTGAKDPAKPDEKSLLFVKKERGRPAAEVLPGVLAALLRTLSFPKRMSWDAWLEDGKGALPFGRPIRWIVALLGREVVPFAIYARKDGVRGEMILEAGRVTHGHRFLPRENAGRAIQVSSFADLQEKLRAGFVILDPGERAGTIRKGLQGLAPGGETRDDHGLLDEWRDLVEYPTVVVGSVPEEFRSLPGEVLSTVLVHHQKYLPLAPDGKVPTRFAAVTNTDGAAAVEIVRGMERVVVARLRDAAFFYREDLKRPLADRVADLAGVTFHKGLGTYLDKTERMVRLVDAMGAEMGLLTKPEHQVACEAARLAKADLTTLMVREFPELQGVMGGIYLRAQGHENSSVPLAVQWHYHPLTIEVGSVPASSITAGDRTVFGAVAIADKLDTLAGYFGLGLEPTGSSDPFGLRRAGQGVVRVLLDFWTADVAETRPSLPRLIRVAVAGCGDLVKRPAAEVAHALESFLFERLRYVLANRNFAADEIEAVLAAREPNALDDVHETAIRLAALKKVRAEAREDFDSLAVAFKRARNILGDAKVAPANPALFQENAERELHEVLSRLRKAGGSYEERLRGLADLRGPVDLFFDDVLVIAEDLNVRANRLGLLSEALSLFYRVADISRLGGQA